jgi:hypothetical protein
LGTYLTNLPMLEQLGVTMKVLRAAAGGLKGIRRPYPPQLMRTQLTHLPIATLASLLLLAGCAGNGEGLDASGNPIVAGSTALPLSADFDSIQQNIFTPICSVCHVGGGAPEGLRLDAADSYNLLVGVPSTEVPSLNRVTPGDPANSYIIQKLEGHAAVGGQMPLGGPYLPQSTINFIAQWISNGAPPSATAQTPAASKFVVTAVVPDSSEPVSSSPAQIMIAFNHDLDVTQIDAQSARIEKLGPDQAVSEVVPARLSISSANLKALMIWPSRPLGVGHYRALVRTASPSGFADMAGLTTAFGLANERDETVVSIFDVEVLP